MLTYDDQRTKSEAGGRLFLYVYIMREIDLVLSQFETTVQGFWVRTDSNSDLKSGQGYIVGQPPIPGLHENDLIRYTINQNGIRVFNDLIEKTNPNAVVYYEE